MGKSSLERVYEERGLEDYKLRTVDDLFYIYGVKLSLVDGYSNLDEEDRFIFKNFVINYFNSNPLDNRNISILKVIKASNNIRVEFTKNNTWKVGLVNTTMKN